MTERITIHHGDCLEVLKTLDDESFDSCVTDPPYALVSISKRFGNRDSAPVKSDGATGVYKRAAAGFMGKKWDTGERAFAVELWVEVWRVLKPGAHLLAFGGTRTYHRLACAIEDAGFEIRDQIGWLYGSGFPKSHNQHGDWEGWGTALKPAWEPIVMARKPLAGTVAGNLEKHATGALNIDGARINAPDGLTGGGRCIGSSALPMNTASGIMESRERSNPHAGGRWPANVIHDGSAEVVRAFNLFGEKISGTGAVKRKSSAGYRGNTLGAESCPAGTSMFSHGDSGSAARFFYSAKADESDRLGSKHPTVKPIDLMAYLCRLVTPPGGTVLDPFAGSGSTGMACLREGFKAILIEREDEYVADIRRRIAHVSGQDTPLFGGTDIAGGGREDACVTETSRQTNRVDGIEGVMS